MGVVVEIVMKGTDTGHDRKEDILQSGDQSVFAPKYNRSGIGDTRSLRPRYI
jgi:hypothetical protein